MENKKASFIWKLVIIFFCFAFIAFFSWSEHNAGIFHWWHVYVLVIFTIILAVTKLLPKKVASFIQWVKKLSLIKQLISILRYLKKHLKDNIGFKPESSKTGKGIRREYFMAVIPVYFIVSAYLMQAAMKNGNIDIVSIILSIVVLAFALYLVVVSIYRKIPQSLAHWTYTAISNYGYLAVIVFFIGFTRTMNDLINLKADYWYITLFSWIGLLIIVGMIIFQITVMITFNRK